MTNQIEIAYNGYKAIKESCVISKILGNEESCMAGMVKG